MCPGNDLLTALNATKGFVCLVGAGGKKTTMYALAQLHPGRVAVSSTSHMYPYDERYVDAVVTLDDADTDIPARRVTAFTTPTDTPKRVGGLSAAQIQAVADRWRPDLFLIKADGARARWIKAPAEHEPIIPAFTDTVIPIVSAKVIGRTLDSGIAHRPELLADLLGIGQDVPLTPSHIARLLSHSNGALKNVGSATVVPLINMVDDDDTKRLARAAAEEALEATDRFSQVVLAAMKNARLVAIIERRLRT